MLTRRVLQRARMRLYRGLPSGLARTKTSRVRFGERLRLSPRSFATARRNIYADLVDGQLKPATPDGLHLLMPTWKSYLSFKDLEI